MSNRTPNWLMDAAMTSAHWLWRNKYLVFLGLATSALIVGLAWRNGWPPFTLEGKP